MGMEIKMEMAMEIEMAMEMEIQMQMQIQMASRWSVNPPHACTDGRTTGQTTDEVLKFTHQSLITQSSVNHRSSIIGHSFIIVPPSLIILCSVYIYLPTYAQGHK